ncbi:hypothetical protein [Cupriavidus basilensis]|uniref:hypothetical protein n=1 Tax=Cupriavidus basilensis TaxID=68895 RepID=UPI0039F6BCDC
MRSYQGAVLFVDMLGFSVLTRGQLKLGREECEPWSVDAEGDFPHQLLAAKILITFRKVLKQIKTDFEAVQLAQLSDCAFLWSEDVGAVADAGRRLMNEAVSIGLLCRGGLAFGDILEPDKPAHSLGAFIVGDAVTRAATFEAMGKGMRIFTDEDSATYVRKVRRDEVFHPLVDPLTGRTVDEWRWYEPRRSLRFEQDAAKLCAEVERLVGCHTMLRYSPRFAWSATTPEGRRQIACSIVAVSDAMERLSNNGTFEFTAEHLMASQWGRSDTGRKRVHEDFVSEILAAIQSAEKS